VKTCGEASVDEEKFYRNCNKQVVHTVNSAIIFSFPFQKWKYVLTKIINHTKKETDLEALHHSNL
jgi:hypothetical protein